MRSDRPSWAAVWIVFAVTLAAYFIYDHYAAPLKALDDTQPILDMRDAGYTANEAKTFLTSIGEDRRALYVRTTVLDTIWPLLLAISSALFALRVLTVPWLVVLVTFIPAAFGLLDAIENVSILVLLSTYPDVSTSVVTFAGYVTRTKWIVIPMAFTIFFCLPLAALWRLWYSNR